MPVHPPPEQRYRWSKQAVRRALTWQPHCLKFPAGVWRSFPHSPDSTDCVPARPYGTFPHRNKAHLPQSCQKIPEKKASDDPNPHWSQHSFQFPSAPHSGTKSLPLPDESRCLPKAPGFSYVLQYELSFLPAPRTDPESVLPAEDPEAPSLPWRWAPEYNKFLLHEAHAFPAWFSGHSNILPDTSLQDQARISFHSVEKALTPPLSEDSISAPVPALPHSFQETPETPRLKAPSSASKMLPAILFFDLFFHLLPRVLRFPFLLFLLFFYMPIFYFYPDSSFQPSLSPGFSLFSCSL